MRDEDREVPAESLAGLIDDRLEDLVEIGQGGDRDADAMERPGRRLPSLEIRIALAQLGRQAVDPPERDGREGPGEDRDEDHHHDGVEREREGGVEHPVADQLDDRHGDDGYDDAEPAKRSHARSIGPNATPTRGRGAPGA